MKKTKKFPFNSYYLINCLWLLLFSICFSTAALGATYYISPGGNDSNQGTQAQPFATFVKAFSVMQGGDTLYVMDGVYNQSIVDMPSGSPGNYTKIYSLNNHEADIDGQGNIQPLAVDSKSYVEIRGFKLHHSSSHVCAITNSNNIILRITGVWQAADSKYLRPIFIENSSDVLIEDVWAFGRGRYTVHLANDARNCVLRRVVARWDEGAWSGEPIAGFSVYKAYDNTIENCITFDHMTKPSWHNTDHSGFYVISWADNQPAASNNQIYGSIALGNPAPCEGFNIQTTKSAPGIGNGLTDCASVDNYRGASVYEDGSTDTTIDNCTFMNNVKSATKSHGFFNGFGTINTVVKNTASIGNLAYGYADNGGLSVSYSGAYDNTEGNYNGVTCSTGCQTDSPEIKYLVRIEDTSPYKGAGENGVDIGANVIYRYVDGVLTNQPLWPWPHEDWIKEDMLDATFLTEVGRTGSDAPGWATANKTLTEYIWEYLGNPIPPEIYGSTGTPTITITQPTSSTTFSTGNSTVTLGGIATDDISISNVTWSNLNGGNGIAQGTTSWTIPNIPLQLGSNIITVTAQDSDGNTNTDTITVTYSLDDTEVPTTPTNLTATAISSSQINLSWTASTDNIGVTGYNIYRDGSQIANATNTTYQDTGLFPSTTYTYTVSAYDAAGNESAQSNQATATISEFDNISPTITSVNTGGDPNQVIVVFSEPVEQASATNTSNYNINNGITISDASLGSDLKTVTLTTSPHTGSVSYTLTVNNIKDRAGIPNVIVSNTQVTYAFLAQLVISNLTVASGKTYEVEQNGLQTGALVYIDRTYTFSTVSTLVKDAAYIKTANDDKEFSNTSFLTFDVNQDVTVYVAHDDRITTKPSWLTSFTDTGDNLVTTDTTLSMFAGDFPAGKITLGGNEGSGYSMYTIIIAGQGNDSAPDIIPPVPPQGLSLTAQ